MAENTKTISLVLRHSDDGTNYNNLRVICNANGVTLVNSYGGVTGGGDQRIWISRDEFAKIIKTMAEVS